MSGVRIVQVGTEQGFLFAISRVKQTIAILGSLGFVALSVVLIVTGGLVVGILGAGVFGVFALAGLWGLRKPRGLTLTPTRVIVDFNGRAAVEWDAISRVAVDNFMGRNRYLGIAATSPDRVERRSGSALARVNRKLIPFDLLLPAGQLVGDPERAQRAVTRYLHDPELRRAIGTPEE